MFKEQEFLIINLILMSLIPKSHPRAKSLLIREKLVFGFDHGLVAKEGLLAQGRGEAFDYLLGEKTSRSAKSAIKAAAAQILLAKLPVISVNGNIAALCPKEIVRLAKQTGSKIEVNLFYSNEKRKKAIIKTLKKSEAKVLSPSSSGTTTTSAEKIPFLSTILLAECMPERAALMEKFVPKITLAPLFFSVLTMAFFLFSLE